MKTPLLEILIPVVYGQEKFKETLESCLVDQIREAGYVCHDEIRIIFSTDKGFNKGGISIGEKRNYLLQRSKANYVAFFDVDDLPTDKYISELMKGIDQGVDVVSLRGIYTVDGDNPEIFEHSLKYKEWKTQPDKPVYSTYEKYSSEWVQWINQNNIEFHGNGKDQKPIKYLRYPNHLNCMKREIAQQFKFPGINHGEDKAWSDAVFKSGLLKTEYYSDEVIYQYLYRTHKPEMK